MEILDEEFRKAGLLAILKKCFKDYEISKISRIVTSSWYKNEHFRGGYSFLSITSDELNVHASDLATPIFNTGNDLVIQFAGEATHSSLYSTVNGAIETGWREAQRLIDLYKK